MASGRLVDYLGSGIIADRPATPSLTTGAVGLWFATDTSVLSAWDGSVWADVSAGGGGALDDLSDVDTTGLADGDVLTYDSGTSTWIAAAPAGGGGGGTITAADSDTISTLEATASSTYTDLTTPGPSVSITTGTSVIVAIGTELLKNGGGDGNGNIAVSVSGATTIVAADGNGIEVSENRNGFASRPARTFMISGLTPGTNVFTLKYKTNNGNTWSFLERDIAVFAL